MAPPRFFIGFDPVYSALVGTHRIQRVPTSEKNGRRHSSLVHVVMLDESAPLAPTVLSSDVRMDTFRASGPGGQHRNKTDSGVRLTHLPTGTVVTATESRSQAHNRATAWKRLEQKMNARHQGEVSENMRQQRTRHGDNVDFTWTSWRDVVKSSTGSSTSMTRALRGRLGPLL